MYLHRASWHSSATLTEGFPCFFSVERQMPGYNPQRLGTARTLTKFLCCSKYCLFCIVLCIVVCKCVLYDCHRVSTQLQLNIYHIISYIISYRIISYHIISYHIISYHIISYHIISYHIIYHISYHIISHHIVSYIIYHITSYHIVSYIISYHIISIISYHIVSYHYIISYHIIYYNPTEMPILRTLRAIKLTCLSNLKNFHFSSV